MVRAILSGRKTQTRRLCKSLIWTDVEDIPPNCTRYGNVAVVQKCPYGEPGDRLWVKETHFEAWKWRHAPLFAAAPDFIYRADYEYRDECRSVIGCHHWKPSIFMRREAARISLGIVSLSVERLQDISEADALAEGIHRFEVNDCVYFHARPTAPTEEHFTSAVMAYRDLWESINGAGSWDANPWVWVVEFHRVGGPA